MAEGANVFVSALDREVAPGRHGRRTGDAGVIVREIRGAGLATLTARRGQRAALITAARTAFGVELPEAPRRVAGRGIAFAWAGPDQWLAHVEQSPLSGMEALLGKSLAGLVSIVDQSHGRTLLQVTGAHVRDALAKGLAVDLHPRAFQAGHVAMTALAHIGVHLWQIDDAPTYQLALPRGYAVSFWHWLATSSAEFGLELAPPA